MNPCSRIMRTIGLIASILLGMYPSTDVALSATAPGVSTLPAITAEINTPVRLAKDPSGFLYVTNPNSGGVLKYSSGGTFIRKIVTLKNGTGVAIAQNGDLLVTQGTYVSVFNPVTGDENVANRFGTFTYANGIAVDPSGNIYVSDGRANNVKKFDVNRTLVATSVLALSRPAGLAYDTANNLLAVANSLAGNIQFLNPATLASSSVLGTFGYDATHATVKFTYPQGIAFEYDTGGALSRIYVSDSTQSTVQVIDGVTRLWLADIGGYGYTAGKLFTPSDVLFDQSTSTNKRIFVANGAGNVAVFGCDNMQPTNIQVANSLLNPLTELVVSWVNPPDAPPILFSKVRIYRSDAAGVQGPLLIDNLTVPSSYTDSGRTPGTPYYYLVRAVDTIGTEYPNTQPVSGKTRINYNLTLVSSGFGTINGSASVGENATNTLGILDNTVVTLTANPNLLKSVFTGWTGACAGAGTNEICQITMDAAKSVTASFSLQRPFFVDGYYADTLQDAHNTANGSGSIIEAMAGTWPASTLNLMTADRPITVTIKGGYDSGFIDPPSAGTTVITGRINLKAGKTIMNNIRIKP